MKIERLLPAMRRCRGVPAESRRKFRVSPPPSDDRLCLLFEIDGPDCPLPLTGVKPDWLVFAASPAGCVATIVELKATDIRHGVDQVEELARWLRAAFAELPAPHPTIQALILATAHGRGAEPEDRGV